MGWGQGAGGKEIISFLLLLKIEQEKGCCRMCTDLIFLAPIVPGYAVGTDNYAVLVNDKKRTRTHL